jgi:hypothetical protein
MLRRAERLARLRRDLPMFLFGLEFLIPLAFLGLIVLAVTQIVSERKEPDPTGRRPYAIYLFVVTFIALVVALFSLTSVASAVARLSVPERGASPFTTEEFPPGFEPPPGGPGQSPIYEEFSPFDSDVEHSRQAILSGLFFAGAVLVLMFHARRIRDLDAEGTLSKLPIRRSYQVYLYAVCFVAVLVSLVAGALAIFGLVRIVAPGVTGFDAASAERNEGIVQFASSGILALAAYGLFRLHWRRASTLRLRATEPEPPPTASPA